MAEQNIIKDLQRKAQRKPYQRIDRATLLSPSLASYWRLNQPSIITSGIIALCSAGTLSHMCAKWHAAEKGFYGLQRFIDRNFVCSLRNWRAGRWWTTITNSVMHFEFYHLLLNMFALKNLGPMLVRRLGVPTFCGIWILAGLTCSAASLAWDKYCEIKHAKGGGHRIQGGRGHTLYHKGYATPAPQERGCIGASGSLSGLLTTLALCVPSFPVTYFFLPFAMPIWKAQLCFAGFSAICLKTGWVSTWCHAGHLGGMVGGIMAYLTFGRPITTTNRS